MTSSVSEAAVTRMLFLGDAALTDGFQLIGFETWADPSVKELDQVLAELVEKKTNAFVILDSKLAQQNSSMLRRVRAEGGRIIITEVPPLNEPGDMHSEIDSQARSLLGNSSLDKQD